MLIFRNSIFLHIIMLVTNHYFSFLSDSSRLFNFVIMKFMRLIRRLTMRLFRLTERLNTHMNLIVVRLINFCQSFVLIPQSGYFSIFLSLRFYLKSIFENLGVLKLAFLYFFGLRTLFIWQISAFKKCKIH